MSRAVLLLMAMVALAAPSVVATGLRLWGPTRSAESESLASGAALAYMALCVALIVLAAAGVVLLRRSPRLTTLPPVVGLAAMLVGFVIANLLVSAALPM